MPQVGCLFAVSAWGTGIAPRHIPGPRNHSTESERILRSDSFLLSGRAPALKQPLDRPPVPAAPPSVLFWHPPDHTPHER